MSGRGREFSMCVVGKGEGGVLLLNYEPVRKEACDLELKADQENVIVWHGEWYSHRRQAPDSREQRSL